MDFKGDSKARLECTVCVVVVSWFRSGHVECERDTDKFV